MKRIDEKVAISGDGAELIQSYLNELNMKLLAAGITESYSIVMEAETIFISAINELNKTTKVTVYEVQKIIEKQGTPDEIVKRYKQAAEAEMEEEFFTMSPSTRELVKRSTNYKSDIEKFKKSLFHGFGLLTLLLPPILLSLSLIQLHLYGGKFFVFLAILQFTQLTDNQIIWFLTLGSALMGIHEIITGVRGKLFLSLKNSIRIRTYNRSILLIGALASFAIERLDRNEYYDWVRKKYIDNSSTPYDPDILTGWIVLFVIIEIVVFIRDHLSSFYPLQPRIPRYERFLKTHYLLLFGSVLSLLIFINNEETSTLFISLVLCLLATIATASNNYNPGIKFYLTLQVIPMIGSIKSNFSRVLMYIEFPLILIILYSKYKVELKNEITNIRYHLK